MQSSEVLIRNRGQIPKGHLLDDKIDEDKECLFKDGSKTYVRYKDIVDRLLLHFPEEYEEERQRLKKTKLGMWRILYQRVVRWCKDNKISEDYTKSTGIPRIFG